MCKLLSFFVTFIFRGGGGERKAFQPHKSGNQDGDRGNLTGNNTSSPVPHAPLGHHASLETGFRGGSVVREIHEFPKPETGWNSLTPATLKKKNPKNPMFNYAQTPDEKIK